MGDLTRLQLPESWKPFMETQIPPSLVAKLAAVQLAVHRVPKRGHNQHFNYDFATESDITATVREELATRHVVMFPDCQSVSFREAHTKSGLQTIACVMVKFTVRDGETGESFSFSVPGEGQDAGDKCVPKALTSATKYAILKLFLIPTGDDPERDEKPDRKRMVKAAAPASPPANGAELPRDTGVRTGRGTGADSPTSKWLPSPVNGELLQASEWDGRSKGCLTRATGETIMFYTAEVAEACRKAQGAQWPVRIQAKQSAKGNWYVTKVEPVEEGIAF